MALQVKESTRGVLGGGNRQNEAVDEPLSPSVPRLRSGTLSGATSFSYGRSRTPSHVHTQYAFTNTWTHRQWLNTHKGEAKPTSTTPLSHRRGTVLLSKPLKSKKVSTDARDHALAKSRGELQRSEEEMERLRSSNRELEAEALRKQDRIEQLEGALRDQSDYRRSLHQKLLAESKKEGIYWVDGDPLFVIDPIDPRTKSTKQIKAMDINLVVTEYAPSTFEAAPTSNGDDAKQSGGGALEQCLEKMVRSSSIFQGQYYKVLCAQSEVEAKGRKHRRSVANEVERLQMDHKELQQTHKKLVVGL